MGKLEFTPIAMKCTQEQFEAIKPKLNNCRIGALSLFENFPYLVNNADNEPLKVYNLNSRKDFYDRTVYEEWNEEIFLKACGIEVESLEQQRINELIDDGYIVMETCENLSRELPLNEYLQQQLSFYKQKVEETEKAIEEENNIKIGDWVKRTYKGLELFKADDTYDYRYINSEKHLYQKITNPELIKLLENECTKNL